LKFLSTLRVRTLRKASKNKIDQMNLIMAKFAFWLNDNSANQDALKNPVP